MHFCRTCGITENWAVLAWLNYNNASDVKPRNIPRAVELRKRKSVTGSAPCVPLYTTCAHHKCSSVRSNHSQIFYRAPWHCQLQSELLSLRVPPEVQALERGRDADDNHDRDTTKTRAKYEVILQLFVPFFFSSPRQQPGSALTFPCVGRVFTIHAGFECASDARHKYGTTIFTITNTAPPCSLFFISTSQ